MMTLFRKRRAAITKSRVPIMKRARPWVHRCLMPAPRRLMPREKISRKKKTWENRQKSELHGLGLRFGFAGNKNSQRKSREKIGHRKKRKKKHAAVDGNHKNKAHKEKYQA